VTETNTTVPTDTNITVPTETNTTVPTDTNTTPVTETNTTLPEGTVMYEDASEGNTSKWTTFNGDVNSTITNIYDADKQSNVIQVQTVGKTKAYYVLGEKNSGWADIDTNTIQWDMKASNAFKITVYIRSANGLKQLKYSDSNSISGLAYGLGSVVKDGVWRSFERNIAVDLDKAEPGNTLVSINGFRIDFLSAGNISVDNIALLTTDEGTDVTPPTIIVKDGSEITVNQGSTYRAYATAQDSRDGNIVVAISSDTVSVDATTRVVDTTTIGTYIITYTATDSTGNEATATQIIHVI
jgi:hypothetical protein